MNHLRRIVAAMATVAGAVLALAATPALSRKTCRRPAKAAASHLHPRQCASSPRAACLAGRSP